MQGESQNNFKVVPFKVARWRMSTLQSLLEARRLLARTLLASHQPHFTLFEMWMMSSVKPNLPRSPFSLFRLFFSLSRGMGHVAPAGVGRGPSPGYPLIVEVIGSSGLCASRYCPSSTALQGFGFRGSGFWVSGTTPRSCPSPGFS